MEESRTDTYIHDPDSLELICAARKKISSLLPEDYQYEILTASAKPDPNTEGNEALYGCVKLSIKTKADALVWINRFQRKTLTSYQSPSYWRKNAIDGLLLKQFRCDYPSRQGLCCKACLMLSVRDTRDGRNKFNPGDEKVRDHDHLTGRFRGGAHSICNLNFRRLPHIPLLFHSLIGYDSILFIKKFCYENDILSQSKEKYISFFKVDIGLSFRFVSALLDSLSESLDPNQCVEIKRYFRDPNLFNKIMKKGVYPYSYVDTMGGFHENQLPSIGNFYDKLKPINAQNCLYQNYTVFSQIKNGLNTKPKSLGKFRK
ncbi:unnamed protein product [Ceutorhynchus assimilis]|uniref:Uncharacterized protein n=1 Tax=Ceutorhynchus assimilis TaxID=467358 RepID=A0A9N9MFY0_9CUCU|nr:unnamed protein product [Ceutorhynchus assimilis]